MTPTPTAYLTFIAQTKAHRRDIDYVIQRLKADCGHGIQTPEDLEDPSCCRASRERSIAITKLQEAAMWLGMDLKAINEEAPGTAPDPYPTSRNPNDPTIHPTADGLKL